MYLRPFEIAIREGGALGIMTSFNYLGALWTGSHEGLLTELLRKEWGFEGVITTDACVYPYMDAVKMLHAGGDLIIDSFGAFLGQSSKETKLLKAAYSDKNAYATVHALQKAAKDILYALCCVYY